VWARAWIEHGQVWANPFRGYGGGQAWESYLNNE